MKIVSVLNPSILSFNIGDDIILDSIYIELHSLFKETFFIDIPTHEVIFRNSYRTIKKSKYTFVSGTNLLSSNMFFKKPWKLTPLDFFILKNVILLGTGWRNYEQQTNFYAKQMYKRVLHKEIIHSVRDEYTKQRLNDIGINNVLNTACPTMWRLTSEHLSKVPTKISDKAVFTLTDYRKDFVNDKLLIDILINNYKEVYFFMQQIGDYHYINELDINIKKIKFLNPTLRDYDDFLENSDVDYIGTRLHGGVRALQKFKRTIIIGVDNRAKEISKDTNLLVLDRDKIKDELDILIKSTFKQEIKLPEENIEKWKQQFIQED